MNLNLLHQIQEDLAHNEAGVLCTVVNVEGSTPRSAGAAMWVRSDGTLFGTIGGGVLEYHVLQAALKLLKEGGETLLYRETLDAREVAGAEEAACGGEALVFLEVIGRERELLIFGAGHVGKAVARLGEMVGFRVTVWDEREEFANPQNIPWGRTIACPLEEAVGEKLRFHEQCYVVIATRGHALDADVVKALEGKPAAYIGMIGSRKKIATVRQHLLEAGVSQAHLDRIFQPIGLPIRAETPEEIAVSILAEVIAVSRGADLKQLRAAI